MDLSFYVTSGPLTSLSDEQTRRVRAVGADPEALCGAVQGLVVQPGDAFGSGLSQDRLAEQNTRPARRLLERVLELDPSPLDQPRPNDRRVVGTCRHYAVLATAFLRASGVPARARCGFAAYFLPAKLVDHWVTEHWSDGRWVRIDPEILGLDPVGEPQDLRADEFLSGGEAWQQVRAGHLDPMVFGVAGTENWGPGEIRGNAIRDLAALEKIEMLPWDEWGPMKASYDGDTDDDFDCLMDEVAIACAGVDGGSRRDLYARLAVPADMVR